MSEVHNVTQKIKYLYSTHYPWPTEEKCEDFTTTFSHKQTLPLVTLASFPNSGNTWMRYLIEGVIDVFSGSFYYGKCIS